MKKNFLLKLRDSAFSILPITLIVIAISLIFAPLSALTYVQFSICSVFLIFGICLFNIGSDTSLMKMGGYIGSHLSKTKKVFLMLICAFIIGVIVTFAEPDLSVLAEQIPSLNKWIMILAVSLGVGIFLTLAVVRIILKVKISYILAVCYGIILILMFFVPKEFLPIAFDASGVTTGPISVPFIMAFGLGISAVRSGNSNSDDGFGLLALCSIGPILAVMFLSAILKNPSVATDATAVVSQVSSFGEVWKLIGSQILENLVEVGIILAPIVVFFLVYNFSAIKLPWKRLLKLGIGILYTYFGITFFFTGVYAGFLPMARNLGLKLTALSYSWILIPIAFVFGGAMTIAEPAVHILNRQVEDLSSGVISKKSMFIALSLGVAISTALAVTRVLFQINIIYFFFPLIACSVILSFFVPQQFTAIAFDSGGVASGSMASAFILPFVKSVCVAKGLDVMTFGFGTIALVALTPIFVVQLMGLKTSIQTKRFEKFEKARESKIHEKVTIIEFK